jgi:hypothetical protein
MWYPYGEHDQKKGSQGLLSALIHRGPRSFHVKEGTEW